MHAVICVALALAASQAAEARRYEIVTAESEVGFTIKTSFHTVHGSSKAVRGTIELPADPRASGARVEVDATTLDTGNPKRDRDIHEKFLETANHPLLRFHSERVSGDLAAATEGGETLVEVEGEFEAHGVRLPLHATAACRFNGDRVECHVTFPLSLKAFSIRDPSRWFAKSEDALEAHARLVARLKPASPPAAP